MSKANTVAGNVESGQVPGLVALIYRNGQTEVQALGVQTLGGTPIARDSIFRIASLAKPIAAVAAMTLVEEGRIQLDASVDYWLPELANRQVLRQVDGPLADTVPAKRAITLRDLLTMRLGMGHIMAQVDHYPIRKALTEVGLLLGPPAPDTTPHPDEWMRRLGSLPLMYQPGEKWLYDLGTDILGVLIARVANQPLGEFMRERIFEPLGMKDTAFYVPAAKLPRLVTAYRRDREQNQLIVIDPAEDGQWTREPAFPSASGGLVSTADDYLAFCQMMLNRGTLGHARILSPETVEHMTSDQLTSEQRKENALFFGDHSSWAMGMAVDIAASGHEHHLGRFGWSGGFGTTAATDPSNKLIGILMTQVAMDSPMGPQVFHDFWTEAYKS